MDGIAISSLNGDFLTETINKAVDAGIPVVTWDSDAPKSKRIAFYGVDDLAAGRIMGEEAAKLLGRQGQGRDDHQPGRRQPAAPARGRAGGAEDSTRHQDRRGLRHQGGHRRAARRSSPPARNRYPDLGAWISVGGWPVFTRNALDAVDPAKTKFICFDTIPPAPDLLKTGKVQVLLGQKYFGWGSEPVKLLHGFKKGRSPPRRSSTPAWTWSRGRTSTPTWSWKKLEAGQ